MARTTGIKIKKQFEDIHISEIESSKAYKTAILNNDFVTALQILADNPTLQNKIFNASNFNILINILNNINTAYNNNVNIKLDDLLIDFETQIRNLQYKGAYYAELTFDKFNFVSSGENMYMSLIDNNTFNISETSAWLPFYLKGENGIPSLNLLYRGIYNSQNTYNENDVVTSNNKFYYAKQYVSGQPLTNTDYWGILLSFTKSKLQIYTEAPTVPNNRVWLLQIN